FGVLREPAEYRCGAGRSLVAGAVAVGLVDDGGAAGGGGCRAAERPGVGGCRGRFGRGGRGGLSRAAAGGGPQDHAGIRLRANLGRLEGRAAAGGAARLPLILNQFAAARFCAAVDAGKAGGAPGSVQAVDLLWREQAGIRRPLVKWRVAGAGKEA